MYEIQVYIGDADEGYGRWQKSGNVAPRENLFATRAEAERVMKAIRGVGMEYRVQRIGDAETKELDLIKIKAQIKAILAEPSKLQRIAKLLDVK